MCRNRHYSRPYKRYNILASVMLCTVELSSMNTKTISTTPSWEALVQVLRMELQEYGGFLNLLKDQQEQIISRKIDELKVTEQKINAQIETSFALRKKREEVLNVMVQSWDESPQLGQYKKINIRQNLHHFPEPARPLLEALVDEINALVKKTRHILKQNQMLLSRASYMTDKVLQSLQPKADAKTYSKGGRFTQTKGGKNSINLSA